MDCLLFELATSPSDRKRKRLDNESRIGVSHNVCRPLMMANDTTESIDLDHKYFNQPTSKKEDEDVSKLDKYGISLFIDNSILTKKDVERESLDTYSSFPNQRMERRLSIVGHMICHDTIPTRARVQKPLLNCIPEL